MIQVAMSLYNGERYIREQIQSINAQTVLPDELVVCDDCSTDQGPEIIKELQKDLKFKVTYLRNETGGNGYTYTINNALMHCSGHIVFLCDQDDVWLPDKVEKVAAAFEANPKIQVITHNAIVTDGDLNPTDKTLFDHDVLNGLEYGSAIHGFATTIRGDLLKYALPVHTSYACDRWIGLLGTELKVRMPLDVNLAYYRRHDLACTYDYIGAKRNLLFESEQKIIRNWYNFKRTRTYEYFEWRKGKETAILDFCKKLYAEHELPYWCSKLDLDAFYEKALSREKCYENRENIFGLKGIKRLDAVLSSYKRGDYKPFHSYQTAIDDLFRGIF